MKVLYRKKFLKELSRLPAEIRQRIEYFIFEELNKINSISEIKSLEKLKGYPSYYKIRFGSYRVGLKIESDKVILEKVLHRKDIYRYFP